VFSFAQESLSGSATAACRIFHLHGFDQNRIWLAIVQLGGDLVA
jgi:hypothetical protein